MPAAPVSFVLPNPCPQCTGPVHYSGRGRRPTYCGSACKAASASASRPERRTAGYTREETLRLDAADDLWTARRDAGEAERQAARMMGASLVPASAAPGLDAVPVDWTADVRSRASDPAARWLAEHHPDALADFGPDLDDGATSTRVPRPRRAR